jgi:hypothetical protein
MGDALGSLHVKLAQTLLLAKKLSFDEMLKRFC